MKTLILLACVFFTQVLFAQNFEISSAQETYRGAIGDLIKAPIKLKNTSNKSITLILKKEDSQELGSSQKSFVCPDNNCFEKSEDLIVKLEPGQTLQNISIALEAGLVEGFSTVKYIIYNRLTPTEYTPIEISFAVEGKPEKSNIYTSKFITINDVYPNPVTDYANIDYKLHSDEVKTKIVIHTILGTALNEYELQYLESRVKIQTSELSAGIYFYTLYIDNIGVMTRKLIVKK
jgi:hypothetical protein